jgi:cytochrome c553
MKKLMKATLTALLVPSFSGLVCVNAGLAQTSQEDAAREAVRSMAKSVCATCHGVEGRSTDPAIPNLAGQQRAYIEIQLKAFRMQSRRDPAAHDYMWGIASTWLHDDKALSEAANYYSSQTPARGMSGDPAAVAAGRELYEKGSANRSIRACAECHGTNAEGASFFPRLAGQHSEYLSRQLKMLRVRLRDSPVMHGVIKDLTDDEIAAVATFLQSK